jgi:hypothetical protein
LYPGGSFSLKLSDRFSSGSRCKGGLMTSTFKTSFAETLSFVVVNPQAVLKKNKITPKIMFCKILSD